MSRQERALLQRHLSKPSLDHADIVIIGNGIAGLTAAVEARRLAPDKRIAIFTEQVHPTINTPSLKQFAIAKLTREQLLAYPVGTEHQERIHVVTTRVEKIHANSKYVTLSGERGFGYDKLLLATGSAPMGLPPNIPGRNFDGVMTLHRLQDYLDLRRRLSEVQEAVVIGGGVHAIETVMGLLHWGIRTHWLIRGKNFLPKMLDTVASGMVLERIRRDRAIVHTETEVTGVVGRIGTVAGVITNRQERIPCQLVLTCTGTQAVTTLAKHCSVPMKHKKGIIVDDQLHTSVPSIYAAGDAAALKNPQTGEYEPRAQWYAAVLQGRIAGAMLAGNEELTRQPFGMQWHATHLGELSMLTVGDPLIEDSKVLILTDKSQGAYRRLAVLDDRLIGYLALGQMQPDSLAIKRIIDEGHSVKAITRALLKGDFDARQYFSELRSRTARGMITTGRLPTYNPVPVPEPGQVSQVALLPVTGPLPTVTALEPFIALSQQAAKKRREVSPFTGSLPVTSGAPAEEISPFTGNLPVVQTGRNVEARPVPVALPTAKRGGLWAYADQMPAYKSK